KVGGDSTRCAPSRFANSTIGCWDTAGCGRPASIGLPQNSTGGAEPERSTRRKANDGGKSTDDGGGQQGEGAKCSTVFDVQGPRRRGGQFLRLRISEFQGQQPAAQRR